MIASPLIVAPAASGAASPVAGDGADPAASAFAILLAGLLPLPASMTAVPRQAAPQLALAADPGLTTNATPPVAGVPVAPLPAGSAPTNTKPAIPELAVAAPAPAVPGEIVLPPVTSRPQGVSGESAPAALPLAAAPALPQGAASTSPSPAALPEIAAAPLDKAAIAAGAPQALERLARQIPSPAAPPAERGLVPSGANPPALAATVAAPEIESVGALRPAVSADAPEPTARASEPLPTTPPRAAPPTGLPPAAAVPPLESAPAPEGAPDATPDLTEIAPGRTERAASEPAAASQRAAPPPPPVVQIGVQIASAASRRVERMVVQLEPAALGRVEVRLDFSHDNRVSALIAADRPDTLDVLQRDSRALERSLQDAGLRLGENALSFSLRQDHRQQQPGAQAGQPALAASLPAGRGTEPEALPAQWFRAERVLDIHI